MEKVVLKEPEALAYWRKSLLNVFKDIDNAIWMVLGGEMLERSVREHLHGVPARQPFVKVRQAVLYLRMARAGQGDGA